MDKSIPLLCLYFTAANNKMQVPKRIISHIHIKSADPMV